MESFDGENSTTTATISGSLTSNGIVGLPREVKTGKIFVFINLGYSKFDPEILRSAQNDASGAWIIDQTTGKVTASFTAGPCPVYQPRQPSLLSPEGDSRGCITGFDLKGNSLENVSRALSARSAEAETRRANGGGGQ